MNTVTIMTALTTEANMDIVVDLNTLYKNPTPKKIILIMGETAISLRG